MTPTCYLVTTVLAFGPSPQPSTLKGWGQREGTSLSLTCCLVEGLESSFLPSLAGVTLPVLPRPCFAPALSVPVLLPPAVQGSRFRTERKSQKDSHSLF